MSSIQNAAARAELIALNDTFNTICARHDIDGLIALYEAEAQFIAPGKRPAPFEGPARETFGFVLSNKGRLSHSVESLTISDDGTLATMIGGAVIQIEAMNMDATGTYLFVLKRQPDGGWKIQTDMWHQHTSAA